MIFGIYAVRDRCADNYLNPYVAVNDDVALRQFAYAVSDGETIMRANPDDFELHFIGTFNALTGEIVGIPDRIVGRGSDYVG